jgi:hypothetical protein
LIRWNFNSKVELGLVPAMAKRKTVKKKKTTKKKTRRGKKK